MPKVEFQCFLQDSTKTTLAELTSSSDVLVFDVNCVLQFDAAGL